MRISDWSSDVCSSDLVLRERWHPRQGTSRLLLRTRLRAQELRPVEQRLRPADADRHRAARPDRPLHRGGPRRTAAGPADARLERRLAAGQTGPNEYFGGWQPRVGRPGRGAGPGVAAASSIFVTGDQIPETNTPREDMR